MPPIFSTYFATISSAVGAAGVWATSGAATSARTAKRAFPRSIRTSLSLEHTDSGRDPPEGYYDVNGRRFRGEGTSPDRYRACGRKCRASRPVGAALVAARAWTTNSNDPESG